MQSRCRQARRYSESLEVELEPPPLAAAPIVVLLRSFPDQSVAIVTVPTSERHRIYRRRLVMIQGPGVAMRRGLIDVVRRDEALVRYL